MLIIGQKAGIVWCLDRASGDVVWSTQAGPGGFLGGFSWGLAMDEQRVYLGVENNEGKPWVVNASTGATWHGGGWTALDIHSGAVMWSQINTNVKGGLGMLPSLANGVLLAGSPDVRGHVYALEAETGRYLWGKEVGASVYGGAALDGGCVFIGRG